MNENEWLVYGAAESDGTTTGATADMLFIDVDMSVEIKAVDEHMVRHSYTGETLAGDECVYSWNRYDSLTVKVKGQVMKGGVLKGMMQVISDNHRLFTPTEEITFENQWSLMKGTLHLRNTKQIDHHVQILYRGNKPISITKQGTKVSKTIRFYERKVYGTNAWKNMRVSSLREYRPEVENDVYKHQPAEFTRVDELEEIRAFISSLKSRRLSWEEADIVQDIQSELSTLLES